ncbi:putative UPF0481 protein [Panicum miliaceum]|uniref:UPF0481 protein n=1 Tax=Panicum miliaceum TaxID=4540 RepID=A0A3L6TJ69_PANMI|nr:putative UPF0481 protein [Panicum miliaceum]
MAASGRQAGGRDGTTPLMFNEVRCVVQIRYSLHEEGASGGDDDDITVSAFDVPKVLQEEVRAQPHPPRHAHAVTLENQVPLFLLRKILEPQCASAGEAAGLFAWMVTGLMKELCPFKMMDSFPVVDVGKHARQLEVLYYILLQSCHEHAADSGGTEE